MALKNLNNKIRSRTNFDLIKIIMFALASVFIFVLLQQLGISSKVFLEHKKLLYMLTIGLFVFAALAAFISYYEYHGIGSQEGSIRRGPKNIKAVSITFDDGPSPVYTPKVLDVLKEKNVKATFFLTGKHVDKYPEVTKRIVAEGHEIGNHTFSHRNMCPISRKLAEKEIDSAERAIFNVTGVRTFLFRPPRGISSKAVREILIKKGYEIVLWTISSLDWRNNSPDKICLRIERFIRNGAIILFHDSGALVKREGASRMNTVKALPLVIDMLNAHNYEIVAIEKLISMKQEEKSSNLIQEEAL